MKSALPLHCIFTSPCSHARFRTLIIWNAADMLFKTNNVLMQLEKNCIPTQMFTTKKVYACHIPSNHPFSLTYKAGRRCCCCCYHVVVVVVVVFLSCLVFLLLFM